MPIDPTRFKRWKASRRYNLRLLQYNFAEKKRTAFACIFCGTRKEKNKIDGYRFLQVGADFVVFAGDVGVLKCRTEKDAEVLWRWPWTSWKTRMKWSVLRQRPAAREVPRQLSSTSVDTATFDNPTATLRVLA